MLFPVSNEFVNSVVLDDFSAWLPITALDSGLLVRRHAMLRRCNGLSSGSVTYLFLVGRGRPRERAAGPGHHAHALAEGAQQGRPPARHHQPTLVRRQVHRLALVPRQVPSTHTGSTTGNINHTGSTTGTSDPHWFHNRYHQPTLVPRQVPSTSGTYAISHAGPSIDFANFLKNL